MNLVRLLRSQTGLTQQAMAALAGTSQPTIALYESGAKSPTLATLQRLSRTLGLDLVVTYAPRLTREDQRSLAYHQIAVKKLADNPLIVLNRARRTLNKMRRHHPNAKAHFDRWRVWLKLPLDELIAKILDPSMTAREMRQVTPFAGILSPEERSKILKQFRKEHLFI